MEFFPAVIERATPAATAAFVLADRALITAHPFVTGEKTIRNLRYFLQVHGHKELIMDSGVYSFFKGDEYYDVDYLLGYTEKYIELLGKLNFKHPYVEVDSQYIEEVPGTYLRLRELYPKKNQVIYVWHAMQSQAELVGLAKDYKRIAFSPKDVKIMLKAVGKVKNYKTAVRGLVNTVRPFVDKKHVHILGSVLPELSDLPDNWTCDSASYGSSLFWGFIFRSSKWCIDVRKRAPKDWIVPKVVREMVDARYDEMQRIYKNHPEYGKRVRGDRTNHLLLIAYSLQSWLLWWEEQRKGTYAKT